MYTRRVGDMYQVPDVMLYMDSTSDFDPNKK